MKKAFALLVITAVLTGACVTVIPAVEDAEASFNYGKALMNEGKFALAIIEFKEAQDFYDKAGYTYSVFDMFPYIARAYYLSGNGDEAITTYFVALTYAKDHPDAVGKKETADVMRELADLLVEKSRLGEARYLLLDAAQLYLEIEAMEDYNEVVRRVNEM